MSISVVKPSIRFSPEQLAVVMTLEAQAANLETAANQLGGFLKQSAPAELLLKARALIDEYKISYLEEMSRVIVRAQPGDLAKVVTK